jgi:Domain of unknown function (DUF4157)
MSTSSLTISPSNSHQEQEAETIASQIMRMPEMPIAQRQCAECEKEEHIQRKTLPFIQKQSIGSEGGQASESVSNQIENSRGGGSRMSENTLSFMESRFGADFSGVKIHTDSNAVQMSRELNAQAFTVGSDIYFNSGKYAPDSDSGRHLLAHELTHTVQQGGGQHIQKQSATPTPTTEKSLKDCVNAGLSAMGVEVYITDTAIAACGLISVIAGIAGAEAGVVPPALVAAAYCLSFFTGVRIGIMLGVLTSCVRNRNAF